MHDWGGVGLAFAQRLPERVERLVIINAVPFLPGYRWHRTARIWRTPVLGELAMGPTSRFVAAPALARVQRDARADARRVDRQRARPLRPGHPARDPAPVPQLAAGRARGGRRAARRRLTVPALVVWGMRDPYIPARFGARVRRARCRDAELLELPDAGHWPWLDRPDALERVVEFLNARRRERRCVGAARRGPAGRRVAPGRARRARTRRSGARLDAHRRARPRLRDRRAAQPRPRRRQLPQLPASAATASRCGTTPGTAATTCSPTRCSRRRSALADRPAAARGALDDARDGAVRRADRGPLPGRAPYASAASVLRARRRDRAALLPRPLRPRPRARPGGAAGRAARAPGGGARRSQRCARSRAPSRARSWRSRARVGARRATPARGPAALRAAALAPIVVLVVAVPRRRHPAVRRLRLLPGARRRAADRRPGSATSSPCCASEPRSMRSR